MDDVQYPNKRQWRQGSLVRTDDHLMFLGMGPALSVGDRLVVISHSCDLQRSMNAEPEVELMIARFITEIDGNLTFGKNPRKLHLDLQTPAGAVSVELCQTDKLVAPKSVIQKIEPDPQVFISDRYIKTLRYWLAARYDRPAFPDNFNSRIGNIAGRNKKITRLAKKISPLVSGLYVQIHPMEEIEEDQQYAVTLLALVPLGVDSQCREITDPISTVASIMRLAGMDVEFQIAAEDTVSYAYVNNFHRWSFDHITLAAEPENRRTQPK